LRTGSYRLNSRACLCLGLVGLACFSLFAPRSSAQQKVTIRVDAASDLGPLKPVWSYFGYDEPNYTYMSHGRELISELVALSPTPVYIRTHNLLTSGDGTPALKWGSTNAYTEDAAGRPINNWKTVDQILDTYVRSGAKPFVEIGFMPEALSVKPQPYKHNWPNGELFTGWSYPPKDYAKWAELVRQLVQHCVERFGKQEVGSWYFEVWNEPDIGYWHGTADEYDKLYDFSADAAKSALPAARVGGPATTGPAYPKAAEFLRQFLEHCARGRNFATGQIGAPLDFVSFHAKGNPKFVARHVEKLPGGGQGGDYGHVQMGLALQLRSIDRGFEIVASFPEFAKLPIVLSESDPDGCAACASRTHPQFGYRNGTLYPTYTAATMNGTLELARERHIDLIGVLTWAFEFEDQPYFEGLRTLATNEIDKPELNFFRMAGLMAGEQVKAVSDGAVALPQILSSGVRAAPDVDALAARADRRITVMTWNYHDDDVSAPDTLVALDVSGLPVQQHRILLRQCRLDRNHSNSYAAWLAMGSPQNPTPEQDAQLKAAGQLQLLDSPRWINSENGHVEIEFSAPRESVSLLELAW
jgi:xylan 1,4-beta-xylosidase